ncbi:MAG: cupin domain-containing protein [Casimicrobiaceae bacterium]
MSDAGRRRSERQRGGWSGRPRFASIPGEGAGISAPRGGVKPLGLALQAVLPRPKEGLHRLGPLPRRLHIPASAVGAWVAPMLDQSASESRHRRNGSAAVLERVSEMVFACKNAPPRP